MIKIMFLIENLSEGGAEKVLRDLVNHMDQTKFDITVQTVWPCDASKYLEPGIHYKSMYPSKSKVNQFRYRAEAASGLAYRLHIKDDYNIEVAYLEMGPTKVISASTNKKSKKLAWVHCDLKKAVSDLDGFAAKTSSWYAKYDKIVCVSKTVRNSFDELFGNRFDSTVIYNVIDDSAVRYKAQQPLQKETIKRRLTVLSAGRLSYPKNYLRLLQTHKRLLDEGIEHDLWIIGEGAERSVLEQYVKDNDLYDSVWMPGFIENPYPYMQQADLLACSSIYEGFSTFVTEGIILGKPIVTTDVSGMHELLGDSEYGLITENDDEGFYAGMKRMMTDIGCRDMYTRAADIRSKTLSANVLTDTTQQFFEELMDR